MVKDDGTGRTVQKISAFLDNTCREDYILELQDKLQFDAMFQPLKDVDTKKENDIVFNEAVDML